MTATEYSNAANSLCLADNERDDFYGRMRGVIVVITGIHFNLLSTTLATGVLIEGGFILSCLHVLRDFNTVDSAIMVQRPNAATSNNARVVFEDPTRDLILLDDGKGADNYAVLGLVSDIHIGMEAHTISHPLGFECTLNTSRIICSTPPKRPTELVMLLKEMHKFTPRDHGFLEALDNNNCSLIQIHNNHGDIGAYGSPIFNSCGRVIGLLVLKYPVADVGVMVNSVRAFVENFRSQASTSNC